MLKLFSKILRRRPRRELAPQFTYYERRAIEQGTLPAGALPNATYEQMERDAMVQTALSVKRLGVLAAPWKLTPSDSSPSAVRNAAFVTEMFERMEGSPNTVLDQAMLAFSRGWSVQELVLTQESGFVWLQAVRPKDPSRFAPTVDDFGRVSGLVLRLPGEVERMLPRSRFVIYTHRAGLGHPRGRSDLDAAYTHWRAKSALLSAWRAHLERFASPTVTGKYQRGLPPEERAQIVDALNRLPENRTLVYPEEITIETLGGAKESSTGFMEALDFHNREIARSILGQTLTTDEGRRVGSLALGKVHLQVLLLQLEAIRRELADTVMTEQVVRPLVELNFGEGHVPRFEFEAAPLAAFTSGVIE